MPETSPEVTQPAACVIGYPAKHSRSPTLHKYWIKRYGVNADYRAEEIAPDDIEKFILTLSEQGYVGANVTMPYKDIACRLAEADERATTVGAANTLWFKNGLLRATNTDIEGFIHALDAAAPGWDSRTDEAIVLGAGGAGRAIVYGLLERSVTAIHVVNRSQDKAATLRDKFGDKVKPAGWDKLSELIRSCSLLINTTSLGMKNSEPLNIDITPLPGHAVVSDIVYVPLTTSLLNAAKQRGHPTVNGLDMLLHQAVRGFELWFGIRPEVTSELYDLLAKDIQAGH